MLDILTFIFGSFWRWAGTVILIGAVGTSLSGIVQTIIVRTRSDG